MVNRLRKIFILSLSVLISLNSCLRGDENPIDVDDGIYIKGKSTAFNHFDENGLMKPAINEVDGLARSGLYEIFIAISSESDGFNIIEVINKSQTSYGPSSKDNILLNGENGQIKGTVQKGVFGPDAGIFTVPENGIYHIIIDKQTSTFVISHVSDVSLYDHATGEEWCDTVIPLKTNFDKSNMMFELNGLDLTEGEFRFRYGHGNKIEITGNEVKVHTSFGGAFSGTMPGFILSMIPGGNNYLLDTEKEGTYTLNVIWTVGQGFAAQMTETGSSTFPEKLFMIGDGISSLSGEDSWNWDLNNFEMIPVYSQPHLFWKIVWMNSTGGIRIAPQKGSENDFGKEGDIADELYNIGEQDIPVPGEANYFMITVNLQTNQISVSQPAVYLIGDAVGSWDTQNIEALFTVDQSNKIVTAWRAIQEGYIKMYAWNSKGWFSYWWNAEFNIINGEIKYAINGISLENVYLTSGTYKVKLDFITGQGVFEKCTTCSK